MHQKISHHCFEWLVAWPAPSHYLNQCWKIVNWTLGNKLQWNLNRNLYIFIQENEFGKWWPFCLSLDVLTSGDEQMTMPIPMAPGALAPCSAKTSTTTMPNKWVLVFHREEFQLPPTSQCNETIENTRYFYVCYLVTLLIFFASMCHGNVGSTTSTVMCEWVPWHFHI